MLVIPGQRGKDLCDRQLGMTRRDLLRVGGSAMLGLSLGDLLKHQAAAAEAQLRRDAGARGMPFDHYREILQRRYKDAISASGRYNNVKYN